MHLTEKNLRRGHLYEYEDTFSEVLTSGLSLWWLPAGSARACFIRRLHVTIKLRSKNSDLWDHHTFCTGLISLLCLDFHLSWKTQSQQQQPQYHNFLDAQINLRNCSNLCDSASIEMLFGDSPHFILCSQYTPAFCLLGTNSRKQSPVTLKFISLATLAPTENDN